MIEFIEATQACTLAVAQLAPATANLSDYASVLSCITDSKRCLGESIKMQTNDIAPKPSLVNHPMPAENNLSVPYKLQVNQPYTHIPAHRHQKVTTISLVQQLTNRIKAIRSIRSTSPKVSPNYFQSLFYPEDSSIDIMAPKPNTGLSIIAAGKLRVQKQIEATRTKVLRTHYWHGKTELVHDMTLKELEDCLKIQLDYDKTQSDYNAVQLQRKRLVEEKERKYAGFPRLIKTGTISTQSTSSDDEALLKPAGPFRMRAVKEDDDFFTADSQYPQLENVPDSQSVVRSISTAPHPMPAKYAIHEAARPRVPTPEVIDLVTVNSGTPSSLSFGKKGARKCSEKSSFEDTEDDSTYFASASEVSTDDEHTLPDRDAVTRSRPAPSRQIAQSAALSRSTRKITGQTPPPQA
jgi:hypothetical protein